MNDISSLKKAVKIDTSLYDAYYGLGTFHYWRSAKSKILRFLIFRKDQQKGINKVWRANKKGRYTDVEGKYALVAIYYDCGDYEKAFALNQELNELFPTNPSSVFTCDANFMNNRANGKRQSKHSTNYYNTC